MNDPMGRLRLLEGVLENMSVAITYADSEGTVLYRNPIAAARPSKTPREVGVNLRDCHKAETNPKITRIFDDFRNGRREAHYYVSMLTGKREKVTIIPFFEDGAFVGCMSQIHPLELEGPERTF
jgi:DUF438 domain-containing protein